MTRRVPFPAAVALIGALALLVPTAPPNADELPVSATDRMMVPVLLGASLLALPEAWIDPGWRAAAEIGPVDTLLLAPPVAAFLGIDEEAAASSGYLSVAILLRTDPDGRWRDLYVERRLAAAQARFGPASPGDVDRAFDGIPARAFHGGVVAASGKSADRDLYLVGALEAVTYGAVALTARIDDAARLYSISAASRSRDVPIAIVVSVRMDRPLAPGDLALLDATVDTVNTRFDLKQE